MGAEESRKSVSVDRRLISAGMDGGPETLGAPRSRTEVLNPRAVCAFGVREERPGAPLVGPAGLRPRSPSALQFAPPALNRAGAGSATQSNQGSHPAGQFAPSA
jgi:hypothetical protein